MVATAAAPSTPYPDILGIPTQNMGWVLARPRHGGGLALGAVHSPPQRVPVPPFPTTLAPGWSLAGWGGGGGARAMPGQGPSLASRLVSQAHVAALFPPVQGHGQVGCHVPWLGRWGGHRPPPHLPVPGTSPPK